MRMRTKNITLIMTEAEADVITFENTCISDSALYLFFWCLYLLVLSAARWFFNKKSHSDFFLGYCTH
jgi:hypothetical protein